MLLQAIAYERCGEYDKALDLARQCAGNFPKDFTTLYTYGRLAGADKMRRSEAFSILEKALQLNPGDRNTLVLLCNLGTLLRHPRLPQYLEQLRSKKEFASSAALYYQYGLYFAGRNEKAQALIFMRHAVKAGGGSNPDFILNAARCIDQYRLSDKEAVNMYRFYLNHPAPKKAAAVREAQNRIARLSR